MTWRDRFRKLAIRLSILLGLAFLGWIGHGYYFGTVSHGHRDGYVQKLSESNTNWAFKTWEGELAVPGIGGSQGGKSGQTAGGNVWAFSVTDPEIYHKLNEIDASQFARVTYEELRYRRPWGGNTNYRVTGIELRTSHAKITNKHD